MLTPHRLVDGIPVVGNFLERLRRCKRSTFQSGDYLVYFAHTRLEGDDPAAEAAHLLGDDLNVRARSHDWAWESIAALVATHGAWASVVSPDPGYAGLRLPFYATWRPFGVTRLDPFLDSPESTPSRAMEGPTHASLRVVMRVCARR